MRAPRDIALRASASLSAALRQLPAGRVPESAPVLEYEKLPDGRVRIVDAGRTLSDEERATLATQLEAIACKRQAAVDRILAASQKRLRKAAKRAASNG